MYTKFGWVWSKGKNFHFLLPFPFWVVNFCISSSLEAHRLCILNLVEFGPRASIYIFSPPPLFWGSFLWEQKLSEITFPTAMLMTKFAVELLV